MSNYAYFQAEDKKEKTIILIDTIYKDVDKSDYIKYEDFIKFIEKGKKEAFEGCPKATDMFVYLHIDYEESELCMEFWPGRIETDEEFEKRMKMLDAKEASDREDIIGRIKYLAKEYNVEVEIKEE